MTLLKSFQGGVYLPGDRRYDRARPPWNRTIDPEPAVVVDGTCRSLSPRWPPMTEALRRSVSTPTWIASPQGYDPRHLVLPATSSVPMVVKLADSPRRPPAFVMGARGSYSVVDGDCAPSYLELWLDPLAAYRLLGLPMAELSGQLVDLAEVLGPEGRRLGERLRETPAWRQRFALLDRFLLRRLEERPRPSPQVGRAWERLVASGGTVPIARIAEEVGWSHKHLIARFKRQVGLRPKTAARLVRFDRVLGRLDERRGLDWGLVAREAGYADQAHLIRDFHQFTGATPTEFMARTTPPAEMGSGRSISFKTRSPPLPSLAGVVRRGG